MGALQTKTPLERRNTILRRSQRKNLHNLKPKIDNIYKEIRKFKGVTEDTKYAAIKSEIEHLKNDLTKKGRDLQPQIRNLYENSYKRICEADEALQQKLVENSEKHDKKEVTSKVDEQENQSSITEQDGEEITSNVSEQRTVVDVHDGEEAQQLKNGPDKVATVELKTLQAIPEEKDTSPKAEVHLISPQDKRKSILKVGIPLMPAAVLNQIAAQSNRITRFYDTEDHSIPAQDVLARINNIIDDLRNIELQISDFVGKKDGTQYNKIRNNLNRYLVELTNLNPPDDYTMDQLRTCRTYIGSCLSFLDEKATNHLKQETQESDDEVFENNNSSKEIKVDHALEKPKVFKNTAV